MDSASNVDELADTVCCYISSCETTVISKNHVKVYANNKPWIAQSLKQVLMKKHNAFHKGDESKKGEAKKVRAEIKRAKL